jgi:hypothetical protein
VEYDNLLMAADAGSRGEQVMAEAEKAPQTDVVDQVLPLVLELIPGQAGEGLIEVHAPGSYETHPLRKLCDRLLSRTNWSLEEQQVLEDVRRQLEGGRLLCRGRQIDGAALAYAVVEETEAGEKYLYIPVRAIKPQEGGATVNVDVDHGEALGHEGSAGV